MNELETLAFKQELKKGKKLAKVYSKKAFSFLLATVMLIMTCSVAFGISVSAYTKPTTSVLSELAEALQSDVVLALLDTTDSSVTYTEGTNGASVSSVTNTITTATYADYVAIKNIVDLMFTEADYIVWYSSDGVENGRGYNGEAEVTYNSGNADYDRYSRGENMASINGELKARLSVEMGNAYTAYSIWDVIDIIFEEWSNSSNLSSKVYDSSLSCENGSSPSTGNTLTYKLSLTTSDYVGWIADSNNTATDYANMELQDTYTVTMSLVSASCSSCSSKKQYVYLFSDDNNDYITTDTTNTNTTAVKNFISSAQSYETYMDSFLEYTSFEAAYTHYKADVVAFENEYNAMVAAQQSMKTTLGGSTYLISMFTNGSAYETVMDNYEIAMDAGLYEDAALGWYDYEANYAEYGVYNYNGGETFGDGVTLNADYVDFTTNYYDILMGATSSAQSYFISTYDLDTNYYTEFTNNVNAYKAVAIKAELDALVEEYADIDPTTLDSSEQQIIYTAVDSYLTTLSKYDSKITSDATLFEEDDFSDYYDLEATYACTVNSTVAWFFTWGNENYNEYTTTELLNVLDEYDSYVTKLNAFKNTIASTVGEERATELLASTYAYTDEVTGVKNSIIVYLADRLTGQVSTAVKMYESINVTTYTDIDVLTFAALKTSVGAVDTEIYDLLVAEGYWNTTDEYVTSQTISDYNSLDSIIKMYTQFAETMGFDKYVDSSLTYTYSSRAAYETIDVVKDKDEDAGEVDVTYDVDSDDINNIITTIDSLLQDEAILTVVGELLGIDISDGLSDVVKDLISDMLFSDSIINVIMGTVYPLIEANFAVDMPLTYDIVITVIEINYTSDLPGIADKAGLSILPEYAADRMTDKTTFADAYTALMAAGQSWYSSEIYDLKTGTWTINWGIDDAKAAGESDEYIYNLFVSALGNALEGLYPLLAALLCGIEWDGHADNILTIDFIGTHTAGLDLGATACDGYVNALGAIYEVFGYYNYASPSWMISNISTATDIFAMIFSDVYGLIDYIFEAPLENILDAIPNLVYALMFDMIPELLTMLSTDIVYVASANVWNVELFKISDIIEGAEAVNIGEMMNLEEMGLDTSTGIYFIFDLLGIEVTGLDEGLLATLGSLEPVTDTNRTDFVYTNSHNGAWHIDADTEDVFYYIITFLIDYVKSEDIYDALGSFMDADAIAEVKAIVDMLGFNETYVSSGDVVAAIAELFEPLNYGDEGYFSLSPVAADLDTYTDPDTGETYTAPFGYYFNEETGYFERETYDEYYYVGNDENGDPIYEALYTEYWTQEKAEYVAEDLPNYIGELASLFDLDTTVTEMLTTTVTDLLDGLYTTDTIDMLLNLIQPLVIEYTQDDETIAMIIDIVVELDIVDGDIDVAGIIDHLVNFTYEAFEDGDRDAFVAVVVDFLEPLVPVLDFFLLSSSTGTDSGSISVYDGTITVNSYDGYTSALVPLLEALGCDSEDMLSYDAFAASTDEEKILAILDPILGLIDTYFGDTENEYAIYSILQIIPNILYFIEYGGLNEVISNILRPVYVVLDTIRPIYNLKFSLDIDVYDLIDTLVNDLIADADIDGYLTVTINVQSLITELMKYGYTEERTSVTGDTYNYFVLYEAGYSELITVVLNTVVDEIVFGEEIQQYIDLLGSLGGLLGEESEIGVFLTDLSTMESSDQVMLILYYLVYGLETGTDLYDSMSETVKEFLISFIGTDSEYFNSIFDRTSELLSELGAFFGGEDYDAEADEVLSWFQQLIADIKAFFEKIFAWLSF